MIAIEARINGYTNKMTYARSFKAEEKKNCRTLYF